MLAALAGGAGSSFLVVNTMREEENAVTADIADFFERAFFAFLPSLPLLSSSWREVESNSSSEDLSSSPPSTCFAFLFLRGVGFSVCLPDRVLFFTREESEGETLREEGDDGGWFFVGERRRRFAGESGSGDGFGSGSLARFFFSLVLFLPAFPFDLRVAVIPRFETTFFDLDDALALIGETTDREELRSSGSVT